MAGKWVVNTGANACTYDFKTSDVPDQVSDLCCCFTEVRDGHEVQAYWSQADQACVIPEAWSTVYAHVDSDPYGGSWTPIGNNVRQLYASETAGACTNPPCLVGTDGSDNLVQMQECGDDCWSWSYIAPPPSGNTLQMLSLGQGWMLGLDAKAGTVWRWNAATSTWTNTSFTGGELGSPLAVYSGAFDVAVDLDGNAAMAAGNSTSWSSIGGKMDQLIVGDSWAAGLDVNRDVKLIPATSQGSSFYTGQTASELFVGGWQTLAGRNLDPARDVSAMTTSIGHYGMYTPASLNTWWSMCAGANSGLFALSGDPSGPLASLDPVSGQPIIETLGIEAPYCTWYTSSALPAPPSPGSSTSELSVVAGRLIGGGDHLYAVSGLNY